MISDLLNSIWFEVFAALLAITYLVLAMQQDIRCWIAWIISSVMYFFVMLTAGLVMEAALQIFYLIMGLYGWSQWKRKASSQSSNIKTWTLRQHFSALSLLFVLLFVLVTCLQQIQMLYHHISTHLQHGEPS